VREGSAGEEKPRIMSSSSSCELGGDASWQCGGASWLGGDATAGPVPVGPAGWEAMPAGWKAMPAGWEAMPAGCLAGTWAVL